MAFQGEPGAYGEGAVADYWGGAATAVPARACADVARLVASGAVERGVLPVENSLAGSVAAAYDALLAFPEVRVVGEVVRPIHHCLLARSGVALGELTTVASHPIALAQCGAFLARHPRLEPHPAHDTAGAARLVAERGDRGAAAIAGEGAAARWGLAVLATNLEDRPDNRTRFVVLGREPAELEPGEPARTALVAVTDNVPGALVRLLAPVAELGLNLSALESRPTGEPWSYRFVLEVEHQAGDPRLDDALAALGRAAREVRVVGTFARAG